jgi:hypothetical protein
MVNTLVLYLIKKMVTPEACQVSCTLFLLLLRALSIHIEAMQKHCPGLLENGSHGLAMMAERWVLRTPIHFQLCFLMPALFG